MRDEETRTDLTPRQGMTVKVGSEEGRHSRLASQDCMVDSVRSIVSPHPHGGRKFVATRSSVECWMVNPSGEVLLLHVPTSPEFLNGFWQPLTGGTEEGESALQAAIREIREETGLTVDPSYFVFVDDDIRIPISEDLTVSKSLFTVRIANAPIIASADEHDGAQFFPRWEVEQRLSYPSNRMTWGRVRPMLG